MGNFGWDEGYRKVGKKARRGRKHLKPGSHRSHHKNLPSAYDCARAAERRARLIELRARDLDDEESIELIFGLEPSDFDEEAA